MVLDREHHLRTYRKHVFLSPVSDPLNSEDGGWAICSLISSAGPSDALSSWRTTLNLHPWGEASHPCHMSLGWVAGVRVLPLAQQGGGQSLQANHRQSCLYPAFCYILFSECCEGEEGQKAVPQGTQELLTYFLPRSTVHFQHCANFCCAVG